MQSMTGFASTIAALDVGNDKQVELSLSIRSVNSRFFDASVRAPYALSGLESDSIKMLRSKLRRGTVHMTVHLNNIGSIVQEIIPSVQLAKAYLKAAQTLKDSCKVTGDLNLLELMRLPDIMGKKEFRMNPGHKKTILQILEQTVTKLVDERNREGIQLAKDIGERIERLGNNIDEIHGQVDAVLAKRQAAINAKAKELAPDENQCDILRSTLQVYLDKLDVTEEIVRFKSHLKSFREILADPSQEKGKKLDFTTQELFRESNTIASKCGHGITSSTVISIKSELEKIREQLQNIV